MGGELNSFMTIDIAKKASQMAMQLHADGQSKQKVLGCLIEAAETIAGTGAVSSILVLDADGLLRNGHSPNLPFDYLTAIDGLKPHPSVGTCASSAATGLMVITRDFK